MSFSVSGELVAAGKSGWSWLQLDTRDVIYDTMVTFDP